MLSDCDLHNESFEMSLDLDENCSDQDENDSVQLRIMPADPEIKPIALDKLFREASPSPTRLHSPTKKDFADSAFYHDNHNYYPTVAEQKELAKKVARTLFDTRNVGSKGSNMFERRRQRADKWTTEEEEEDEVVRPSEPDVIESVLTMDQVEKLKTDPTALPLSYLLGTMGAIPRAPAPPPPKTVKEFMEKVQKTPKADHRAVNPEKCFDIAAALHNSHDSKGAALFNKRRAKSQKWVLESGGENQINESAPPLFAPTMAMAPGPMKIETAKSLIKSRVPAQNQLEESNAPVGEGLAQKIQRLQSASDAWEESLMQPTASMTDSTPINSRSKSVMVESTLTKRMSSSAAFAPAGFQEMGNSKKNGWRPVRYTVASGPAPSADLHNAGFSNM